MSRTIAATAFKAKCSEVIDSVARGRGPVLITRRGRPIARVVPVAATGRPAFGCLKGEITIHGDILDPIDVEWEAMK